MDNSDLDYQLLKINELSNLIRYKYEKIKKTKFIEFEKRENLFQEMIELINIRDIELKKYKQEQE